VRQDLEDMPQVSLEPLELGDHRSETVPQVECCGDLRHNSTFPYPSGLQSILNWRKRGRVYEWQSVESL
jgi:hypothetical protein